jgi:hypothetical protein
MSSAPRHWLLIVAVAFASSISARNGWAGVSVTEATDAQKASAQERYAEALRHFEAGRYDDALQGFKNSYDIVESPNSRLMAARALVKLERWIEAHDELTATAKQADELAAKNPDYKDTADAAREQLEEVRPHVGYVRIKFAQPPPKDATLTVAGRPAQVKDEPIVVPAGNVDVVVTRPNAPEEKRTVRVSATETVDVELGAPASAPPKQPVRHPMYRVELDGHLAFTAFDPPGEARPGAGPGGRVSINLVQDGPFPNVANNLALSAGADIIVMGGGSHVIIPILVQWNYWFTERVALLVEPGAAAIVRDGTFIRPAVYGGIRYLITDSIAVTARAGYPGFTVGASVLF